jgi:hypothetical protein
VAGNSDKTPNAVFSSFPLYKTNISFSVIDGNFELTQDREANNARDGEPLRVAHFAEIERKPRGIVLANPAKISETRFATDVSLTLPWRPRTESLAL